MKYKFFIIIAFISFFQSCKKKADEKFVRTWHDTEYIILGKTTLKINPDFTFNYSASGCMWRCFSKGKWNVNKDTLELNSTSIDTCYNMFPFADCPKFGKNKKIITTVANCTAETETAFIIFKREKFYLKNDSLVYMQNKKSNCPPIQMKFAKTEKIEKKATNSDFY